MWGGNSVRGATDVLVVEGRMDTRFYVATTPVPTTYVYTNVIIYDLYTHLPKVCGGKIIFKLYKFWEICQLILLLCMSKVIIITVFHESISIS